MQTDPRAQTSPMVETIRIDLPAAHRYLNIVGVSVEALIARIDNLTDADTLSYGIQLAVHEACTNIIDHAYAGQPAGRIEIVLTIDTSTTPARLSAELRDTGVPFDPTRIQPPDLSEPHEHGYGLFLIRELMDEMTYHSGPDGNRVFLRKTLS
jgi:serine/threonine-protein kinase RsbW